MRRTLLIAVVFTAALTLPILVAPTRASAETNCWCQSSDDSSCNHFTTTQLVAVGSGRTEFTCAECSAYCEAQGTSWASLSCDSSYIDWCTSAGTSCVPRAGTSCSAGAPPAPPPGPDSGEIGECAVTCAGTACPEPAAIASACAGTWDGVACVSRHTQAECTAIDREEGPGYTTIPGRYAINAAWTASAGGSRPITPGGTTGDVVGPGGSRGAAAPTLPNPLGGTTDIRTIIGRVISAALGISGSIALLMFIWGGMLWLTSGGSPERIKKGKDAIVWAVLGLVLIFGSYAILNFVLGAILSA